MRGMRVWGGRGGLRAFKVWKGEWGGSQIDGVKVWEGGGHRASKMGGGGRGHVIPNWGGLTVVLEDPQVQMGERRAPKLEMRTKCVCVGGVSEL